MLTIIEAKNKAIELRDILENQIVLDVKKQRQLIKLLDSFINCHNSSPAIHTKYAMLKSFLISVGGDNA